MDSLKKNEYIYLLDVAWIKDSFSQLDVKYGTIVHDVYKKGGKYFFHIDDSLVLYSCTYQWAFAENTSENIKRIEEYLIKDKEHKRIGNERDTCFKKIKLID